MSASERKREHGWSAAGRRVHNFIDGEPAAASGKTFESRCPVDNSVVAVVDEASQEDVDRAVRASRRALAGEWGAMSVTDRAAILDRVADILLERVEEFTDAEIGDTGKLLGPTLKGEIPRAAMQFRVFADIARSGLAMAPIPTQIPGGAAMNYPERAPKGVVAAICPWNLPLVLATWKIAPALACGNAIVVKPSEETPVTATLLGEVMSAAGLPPGAYNVVNGFGPESAGAFLVAHPGVNAITFTGETRTGAAIIAGAAAGIKDVSLELGGKNAAIIFADCDFEKAVAGTAASVFHNCGQVCLCTERVYVERSIFARFVEALKTKATALAPGDPYAPSTTLSPLISLGHREKVLGYFEAARRDGAIVVAGGGAPAVDERFRDGAWIEPTIWTGLPETSRVVKEEVFGPVCHIQPFDADDEAIAFANASDYGLAATVWSRDVERARRVASRIEAGVVWINSWMIRDLHSPFGGFKKSGIGREGGEFSLDFYSEVRNVCVNET
jgi:aminomuconate-semialdehyde/2-hydroxymuconate-6-semialdehyde dehydrogenase